MVNMTTSLFATSVIKIVSDLAMDVPERVRYQNLLESLMEIFPCDAAALLRLEGAILRPLAAVGLSQDVFGRRFVVEEHPRLLRIVKSPVSVRFEADSSLPDPYDGLVNTADNLLNIHDCMGVAIQFDGATWGVLTFDALDANRFDAMDLELLATFVRLTEATVQAAGRLATLTARAAHARELVAAVQQSDNRDEIIGESAAILSLLQDIDMVAASSLTVLIMGETGVGKELVAKRIHRHSDRSKTPMIHVNCAALPESLAESELFGHVRGAFTGAHSDRAGRFELADGGTLFLDEIGELPLALQAKILRTLQSGEVQRVGSDHNINVDVRIIAATNRDLKAEIGKGRFRADLYHRIAVYPVTVPNLKDRDADVLLLSGFFLERNQRKLGVGAFRLSSDANRALAYYNWPGNVRELEHLLSRAGMRAISEQGREAPWVTITASHLDFRLDSILVERHRHQPVTLTDKDVSGSDQTMKDALDQYQKAFVEQRIIDNHQNLAATARGLGLNSSNFYRLLKRLGIK